MGVADHRARVLLVESLILVQRLPHSSILLSLNNLLIIAFICVEVSNGSFCSDSHLHHLMLSLSLSFLSLLILLILYLLLQLQLVSFGLLGAWQGKRFREEDLLSRLHHRIFNSFFGGCIGHLGAVASLSCSVSLDRLLIGRFSSRLELFARRAIIPLLIGCLGRSVL